MRRLRIGIDVGGTFTDAVAIDNDTLEIVTKAKVKTTHRAREGVAAGIIQALQQVLAAVDGPKEVIFIAHGTTQATNALLEGDVVPVGIIGMGRGLDGISARRQSQIEDIELANGKGLTSVHRYLDTGAGLSAETVRGALRELQASGCGAIVAAEAYSVDDPRNENLVLEIAQAQGMPGCVSSDISKRYGLKVRTRTAVVNASILPKMTGTSEMTQRTVRQAGISVPLMIMRGDGGVMTVDEMRRRPIYTMLSGPAAGVAGALLHERVSDGIFLEVGGTSTDISAIKNGRVQVDYAEIGGHKTYLRSLDIRTVGLAGGSMLRVQNSKLVDVGARSAHIGGFPYATFSELGPGDLIGVELVAPLPGDPPEYVVLRTKDGRLVAPTLTCAANLLGLVGDGDYARGNVVSAREAFKMLAGYLSLSAETLADQVCALASAKVEPVVRELVGKYGYDPHDLILVGGGGGAAAVVPHLGKVTGYKAIIARNAEYISTIGVALAMVREVVERTIPNPTDQDVLKIKQEAEQALLAAGAVAQTIEVDVEIDRSLNVVRAVATGSTELRARQMHQPELPEDERRRIAAESMQLPPSQVRLAASTSGLETYVGRREERKLLGLLKKVINPIRVADRQGVIRLRQPHGQVITVLNANAIPRLNELIDTTAVYNDAGEVVPNVFLLIGGKIVNLSGLNQREQILSLAETELRGLSPEDQVVLIAASRQGG